MAIDYTFVAVNGGDADVTATFASTAATASARSVVAVSALSAEVTAALALTTAFALLPKTITATQKKALAVTLLLSAGVALDEASTAALLADPLVREQVRLKNSRSNGEKLVRAVF